MYQMYLLIAVYQFTYCLFAFASCESALIFEIEFEMKSF